MRILRSKINFSESPHLFDLFPQHPGHRRAGVESDFHMISCIEYLESREKEEKMGILPARSFAGAWENGKLNVPWDTPRITRIIDLWCYLRGASRL